VDISIVRPMFSWFHKRRRWLQALAALTVAGGILTVGSGPAFAVDPTGYVNPLRGAQGLVAQRIDQGVDYAAAGGSPVYALGNGIVTNLYNSGWANGVFLVYQLTSGPAQGLYVYVAEDVAPAVSVGQQVTSSTVLARFEAGPDRGYDIETGWADPCSCRAIAKTYGQYPENGDATAFGRNFNDLMTLLGAPPGRIEGPETGSLPAGWPVWDASPNPDLAAPGVAVDPVSGSQWAFWRGTNGTIHEAWYTGSWNGPTDTGWATTSAPAVAVNNAGSQWLFWRGSNGTIHEAWYAGGWNGPIDTGWATTSAPAAAVDPATGSQWLFWQAPGGTIHEAWYTGKWNGPIDTGWATTSAPGAAADNAGSQWLFWRGTNGTIHEAWYTGGWNGPIDKGWH
jgi:hypothetical protein